MRSELDRKEGLQEVPEADLLDAFLLAGEWILSTCCLLSRARRGTMGRAHQQLWIALIFAMLFSLSITAWQGYRQKQHARTKESLAAC